jgi:hypothetical protein
MMLLPWGGFMELPFGLILFGNNSNSKHGFSHWTSCIYLILNTNKANPQIVEFLQRLE